MHGDLAGMLRDGSQPPRLPLGRAASTNQYLTRLVPARGNSQVGGVQIDESPFLVSVVAAKCDGARQADPDTGACLCPASQPNVAGACVPLEGLVHPPLSPPAHSFRCL